MLALQGCLGPSPAGLEAGVAVSPAEGFSWVPLGPAGANTPGAWYRSLEDGKCSGVTNKENDLLVRALAAVCRAAIEKKRAEWAVAKQLDEQLAAQPRRDTPADECLDSAGEALLTRALDWHQQHPDTDPVVTFARPGSPVACEFKIIKVVPADGPLNGGIPVEITGAGLNDVQSVAIGAATVKVDSFRTEQQNGATVDILKVTAPAATSSGAVDIAVRNRAGTAVAPAAFTYRTDPLPTYPPPPGPTQPPPPSPPGPPGPPAPSLTPTTTGPTGPGNIQPS
jgi:IPT/TIG domain-containing protein